MAKNVFQVGPIRPPSEANSLLLRVTENCSWNKCKFCMLYKDSQFHTRPVSDIKNDIDVMADYRDIIMSHHSDGSFDMQSIEDNFNLLQTADEKMCYQMVFRWLTEGNKEAIFLQDANTMVIRPAWLIEIVSYIKEKLPELRRITSYGRADALFKIPLEDLKAMKEAGLNRIHSGYESGSDKVLKLIDKGTTQEEEIIGGKKVKEAGIQLSIYFMPGVGGKELSDENAIETAKVINEVNPDFVRLRTFVLRSGSLMEELALSESYTPCTDIDKLVEIKKMIEHIDQTKVNGEIASDHIVNLLQDVEGSMDKEIPEILEYINAFLELPEEDRKRFQLARRMGFPLSWNHLDRMRREDTLRINDLVEQVSNEREWEALLNQYLDRYI